jgi:hypothetical protein
MNGRHDAEYSGNAPISPQHRPSMNAFIPEGVNIERRGRSVLATRLEAAQPP